MMNIEKYLISPDKSIRDAMIQLDQVSGVGLAVTDEKKKLLGSLTDGDIRRGLLRGVSLNHPVSEVMNSRPVSFKIGTPREEVAAMAQKKIIAMIPYTDDKNIVVNLYVKNVEETDSIPVILMAGGLGSRLGELTKECPKPMLAIGNKPLLEIILDNFMKYGFKDFFISVNYKAEVIENYFGNGEKFNCNIQYLKETQRLGTAGALGLVPDDISGPCLVMNADLLTKIDFRKLLDFHTVSDSKMTVCVREYDIQVPYGVIEIDHGKIKSINEKPIQTFNVNAGVYIVDSSLFKYVPKNKYFDMPSLLHTLLEENVDATCFPIIEKWIDVGRKSDLEIAREFIDAL